MTAPTHIAFSVSISLMFGFSSFESLLLLSFGSVLPDIDHPKSFIGKIFYFLSIPLNRKFGHRGLIHSILLWLPIMVLGLYYFKPLGIIGIGVIFHIILDAWNVAGVHLMKPLSEKTYVMAQKKYRIASGSKREYVLLVFLLLFIFLGLSVVKNGGIRSITQKFIGDYVTAVQHYEREGQRICYLSGKFRRPNGVILEGDFLIIGKDSNSNVTVFNEKENEIYEIPKSGEFLRCSLKKTDKEWQNIKFNEPMEVLKGVCYYRIQDKWMYAKSGDVIAGDVVHRGGLEIKSYEYQN